MPIEGSQTISSRIEAVLRRDLNLPAELVIEPDTPLFDGSLDLDSLDALMIVTAVEKEFQIKIPNESVGREVLQSINTLAEYLEQRLAEDEPVSALAEDSSSIQVGGDAGDLTSLLSRLPHAEPFRFVTHLRDIEPNGSGVGGWQVTGDEAFFAGHFPGNPIVPGVLITEALAQLSGLVIAAGGKSEGDKPRAGSIVHTDVRFRRPVQPPATVELRSYVIKSGGGLFEFQVAAEVEGQIVANGSITLRLE